MALARQIDLEPEILFFLDRDEEASVHRISAVNAATPDKASLILAADDECDIRAELAMWIGRIVPGFDKIDSDKTWRTVHQVLMMLVRDQLPRMRRVLSEALKCVPDAAHDIIAQLARDAETAVAGPVLEFSPVLTDEDLVDVIHGSPLTASLIAISKRVNVGEEVSNVIVDTADVDAIAALLNNQSAQIREATLDAIIDAVPVFPLWHEPLVQRRQLPGRAVLPIADFVADSLLKKLAARKDFDESVTAALAHIVRQKLTREDGGLSLTPGPLSVALDPVALKAATGHASDLAKAEKLTTSSIMLLAQDGLTSMMLASLAVKAEIPVEAVKEVVQSASAKGMLAIAWVGNFTADQAKILQLKIARVIPNHAIKPKRDSWFDATEAEME